MSHDPVIVDAENTLMLYQRFLREINSPTVPRQWVETLVNTLEVTLDKYAELSIAFEPEDEPDEIMLLDGWDDDDEEYFREIDDGPSEFPFEGDGDHSDERGNG